MSEQRNKKKQTKSDSVSFSLNRKVLLILAGTVAVIAVGATALFVLVPTKLESAHALCVEANPRFADFSALDGDGKGLFVDGAGDESLGLIVSDLSCIISNVGVPDSIVSRMNTTTALMGQQEATFDGITVRWTYHPNNGLDMSFEID